MRLVVRDPAGDANGINDEGVDGLGAQFPASGKSLGAQLNDLDITGISLGTVFGGKGKLRKPGILNVVLSLSASPAGDNMPRQYKVYFDTAQCARNLMIWEMTPTLPVETLASVSIVTHELYFRPGTCTGTAVPSGEATQLTGFASISGSSLVFPIPAAALVPPRKSALGLKLFNIRGETRLRPRGAYPFPVADVALDKAKSYTIG